MEVGHGRVMRRLLPLAGLALAITAGGTPARPPPEPLAVQLVRADYGAPLRYWGADGRWSARGGEVRLNQRDGAVALWRIAFDLRRALSDRQLRILSGPR